MMIDPIGNAMFTIIPIIIIGVFIFIIVKGVSQWTANNNSPRLTVPAKIVTKRTRTSGGINDTAASTSYFVTFQVESGDRMEFSLTGSEYGLLAEGDLGTLTFQGTRYHRFERIING